MSEKVTVEVGQIRRDPLGSTRFYVVAVEGDFAYVKLASEAKKRLAVRAGSYEVSLREMTEEWPLLVEAVR